VGAAASESTPPLGFAQKSHEATFAAEPKAQPPQPKAEGQGQDGRSIPGASRGRKAERPRATSKPGVASKDVGAAASESTPALGFAQKSEPP
ncbi:MAG TPA: hypothetical protein VFV50_07125, partial [Bdellovibrionales bacterium]|nr:hypothetical protein [Bdellovibrionales bacterium]